MNLNKNILIACIVGIIVATGVFLLSFYSMPDSPLFLIKRWEEKTLLNFQNSPQSQISYNLFLLNRRLTEMDYITANKEYDLFYPCSLRYSSLAGDIKDEVLGNGLSRKAIIQTFTNNQKKITTFYNRKDTHEEWKYIHDAVNYLGIYADELRLQK